MCTYCGSKNYRKIYEKHHGSIPKDEQGRSYDIHHIDGNRNNNDINNLRAVSILEHLSIHRNQKDWGAVMAISRRLQLSPEEISRLSRLTQQERVRKGIHHFLDGAASSVRNRKKVADGTHHFLDGSIQRKAALARFADGTHHLSDGTISKKTQARRVAEGTHNFQDREWHSREAKRRLANGTHNFLNKEQMKISRDKLISEGRLNLQNPNHMSGNKIKVTCPHCQKIGGKVNMIRWHFDNCKVKSI